MPKHALTFAGSCWARSPVSPDCGWNSWRLCEPVWEWPSRSPSQAAWRSRCRTDFVDHGSGSRTHARRGNPDLACCRATENAYTIRGSADRSPGLKRRNHRRCRADSAALDFDIPILIRTSCVSHFPLYCSMYSATVPRLQRALFIQTIQPFVICCKHLSLIPISIVHCRYH